MTSAQTDTTTALPAGTWNLDPAKTTITVTATKLGFVKVPATLTMQSGTIEIDADNEVTGVEVVADAGSYASPNAKRNEHIRSADFLDVDNHPEVTFTAGKVSRTATGYRADGSVTVKGQRSPTTVDISDVDTGRGSFVATATMDRNAIGVDKMPSLVIGSELQLTVTAAASIVES
ncbi:MAG: YceI family protein [Acidimicrobiales bacterium]|nr:YceI family protein [Acidimicrobiales bacterium]